MFQHGFSSRQNSFRTRLLRAIEPFNIQHSRCMKTSDQSGIKGEFLTDHAKIKFSTVSLEK